MKKKLVSYFLCLGGKTCFILLEPTFRVREKGRDGKGRLKIGLVSYFSRLTLEYGKGDRVVTGIEKKSLFHTFRPYI